MKALILLCIIGAAVAVDVESVVREQFVDKNQKESATTASLHVEGSVNQGGSDYTQPAKPTVGSAKPVPSKPVDLPELHEPVHYPFYPGPYYPFSFYNFPYCNPEFQAPFYNYPPYHGDFSKFPQYNNRYQYPFPANFNDGFFAPRTFSPEHPYYPYFYSKCAPTHFPHYTNDYKRPFPTEFLRRVPFPHFPRTNVDH
ncbi:uncharacterized protein LOC106661035 [Cimex lectularius]|uniref:CPR type cuticle protein n=1 Tax=Cimex lectularius TaxID=79782 RepID=A0A8I6R967_CIMLE|nr:uncharacterized protein LOC106661035 [Cimex lectularius]